MGFAFTGVGLAEATGNPRYDALGSLAIGVLLAVIAVILAMEMKSFLIGEAAAPEQVRRIAGSIGTADTAALIDRVEAAVRAQVPEARLIFLEPDVERDGQ